ncbi:MAG TPA: glycosyltransferase family 39 protein, partial [Candidatus Dormibacteraeota bacterium]|nr:glycosyltransferase family 39 protein [Candidatus Dormibacteraeota bacterium]
MLQVVREFRVGRPQVIAGLMLLAFMAQCLWTANTRKLSDLEYRYIAAGLTPANEKAVNASPFTGWVAALPVRLTSLARKIATPALSAALAVPRPWLLRLPFIAFGVWLGAALWWVARRLFDDEGGYVALALYCTSPAMITISSNIGPEIILAWCSLGLIYTAIGVAHTLYAPARKWVPRIAILGLSIGFALATFWWAATLVFLAFGYMMYLAPGCRRKALMVLVSASAIGCAIWAAIYWMTGS